MITITKTITYKFIWQLDSARRGTEHELIKLKQKYSIIQED